VSWTEQRAEKLQGLVRQMSGQHLDPPQADTISGGPRLVEQPPVLDQGQLEDRM
jgi:hypothetical protein